MARRALRLRAGEQQLTLLTTLSHFATAIDVEVTLEAFLPADAATGAFFTSSAGGEITPSWGPAQPETPPGDAELRSSSVRRVV